MPTAAEKKAAEEAAKAAAETQAKPQDAVTPPPAQPQAPAPIINVQPAAIQMAHVDEFTAFVNSHSVTDLDQMDAEYKPTQAFAFPQIGNKTRMIDIPDSKPKAVPVTIEHENRDIFGYSYLTRDDMTKPQFRGYRPVLKGSQAAYNPQGEHIPDHYFQGRNFILVGTHILSFCKIAYQQGKKKTGQNMALEHLRSFMPEQSSADVRQDGVRMGGVVTQEHNLYEAEEYLEKNLPQKTGA